MSRSSFPPLEDDFTRALLRSADNDEPSSTAYVKAAAALGVGVGLGVSASLPASSALAAAAGAVRWSSSLGARLAAFGVSSALLVGSGVLLLRGRHAESSNAKSAAASPARVPTQAVPAQALPALPALPAQAAAGPAVPAQAMPAEVAPMQALPARGVTPPLASSRPRISPLLAEGPVPVTRSLARSSTSSAAVPRRPARVGGSVPPGSSRSSLAAQVQSLDRARVALNSGDAGTALREIVSYHSTWPKGVFLTEASVLEIEALAARGERALAAQRASAFVAAHPDSPQAGRLRSLIPPQNR